MANLMGDPNMIEVKVRMYRQGLGDCFLLTFAGKNEPYHMLIDCGVLTGTPNARQWMRAIMTDIKEATGQHLDCVVVTHEHWDHVSGFVDARDIFQEIQVDNVLLAWTEDPANERARELRRDHTERLRLLYRARARLKALNESPHLQACVSGTESVLSFFGDNLGASGVSTTREAMDFLATLPGATVDYCTPGEEPLELKKGKDAVKGVRIFILGPPTAPELLKRSEPRKTGDEVYRLNTGLTLQRSFTAGVDGDPACEADSLPFEANYTVPYDEAKRQSFFTEHYFGDSTEETADGNNAAWRWIGDDWLAVTETLALELDNDTNNTSLAIAIELSESGKVLLFPGDAQVGNWLSWQRLTWTVKDPNGHDRVVTSEDLLARTVLYKVGHHGSYNATLRKQGLEQMNSRNLVALIPLSQGTAAKRHWQMPCLPLLKRLNEKTRGRVIEADQGLPRAKPELLTEAEWKQFIAVSRETPLYIEYSICG